MNSTTDGIAANHFDRGAAVTRSLLGYGVLAGPFYVSVGLAQALTRDGFDLTRHSLSVLANGTLGWIQIANLALTGLMTIAAAVGIRRALGGRPGGTWGPLLLGGYGLGMIGGAAFVADPMDGFPVGTPDGAPADPTVHGAMHFIAGGTGFLCLVAATFVLGRHFAKAGNRGWAWHSRLSGVAFVLGFVGGGAVSGRGTVLGLWAAVVIGWVWLALLSVHLYRTSPHPVHG